MFAGVVLGGSYFPVHNPAERYFVKGERRLVDGFLAWNAREYLEISRHGYSYRPGQPSNIAFFPALPLLVRIVSSTSPLPDELVLVGIANACFIAAMMVTYRYLSQRTPSGLVNPEFVLLAMAIWPTTFFFRMGYAESLLVLLLATILYGVRRGWPPIILALLVGLASATRPVGVAAILPLYLHICDRGRDKPLVSLVRAVLLTPLACWGLLAFLGFQWAQFGDPLAFNHSHDAYTRHLTEPIPQRIAELLVLRPIWSPYVPGHEGYWTYREPVICAAFSLQFANPLFFAVTALLIVLGARKRWLTPDEWLLAAGLLAIPYLFHSQRAMMMGHARYAAAVFPAYIVMGHLLSRCPLPSSD